MESSFVFSPSNLYIHIPLRVFQLSLGTAEGREKGEEVGPRMPIPMLGAAPYPAVFSVSIPLIFRRGSPALQKKIKRPLKGSQTFIKCQVCARL